jgi:hypothetical protein
MFSNVEGKVMTLFEGSVMTKREKKSLENKLFVLWPLKILRNAFHSNDFETGVDPINEMYFQVHSLCVAIFLRKMT